MTIMSPNHYPVDNFVNQTNHTLLRETIFRLPPGTIRTKDRLRDAAAL
jgi:hypothetical protein